MNKNLYRSKRGQTLIEALVALVFISMGVIALVRFQNYLSYDSSLTQQKAQAAIIAQSTIDTLSDFHVLNTTSGYTAYSGITSGTSSVTGTNATYSVAWTVTTNTNPDYKRIDVSVTWTDRRGASQSVRYISNVAGIEPANSAAVM
jgi:Tfp pilus assembly protein PilV